MLAGRVSAAMAAEIGAMRATEQIDAMWTLSTDPFRYLVAPRLLAGVLVLPLLTAVADTIGFVQGGDVGSGLIKAAVFGFIVALMGCYHGYTASGGARGVGRATTHAV